jgi:hypothetical protein
MITISPNTWPGFGGLYYNNNDGDFDYIIHSLVYNTDLVRTDQYTVNEVLAWSLVPSFEVDPRGSNILVIESDDRYMLYQQIDGLFVELLARQPGFFIPNTIYMLLTPSNDRIEVDDQYSAIQLDEINESILNRLGQQLDELSHESLTYDQLLNILNYPVRRSLNNAFDQLVDNTQQRSIYQPSMIARQALGFNSSENITNDIFNQPENITFKESYEMLLKRLYNLSIILPEYLVINGLKVNFIPFSQVSTIQIQKYIIDPLFQPWTSSPNKVITIFDKNGMTYLVHAQYDQSTNQIFPPI